jgi:DNA processing protein
LEEGDDAASPVTGGESLDIGAHGEPDSVRARVLELLSPSPISLDELVRAAEAPIRDVRIVLLELELAGKLEYSGGARVALVSNL